MYEVVKLITLAPQLAPEERGQFRSALQAATAALPSVQRVLLEPVLPGSYNVGDFIWRVSFEDARAGRRALADGAWRDTERQLLGDRDRVAQVEHAASERSVAGGQSPGRGVYRVALFCANQAPSPERLARFAAETEAMPRHIRSIRSWRLATACEAEGSRPWTHVWEQEYADLEGLTGAYMMHPYHWAHVDRWFDPEWPEWLVDRMLCHAFCTTSAPVIGPSARG